MSSSLRTSRTCMALSLLSWSCSRWLGCGPGCAGVHGRRGDDRGDQAGGDVVDVAGNGDRVRQDGGRPQELDVGADGLLGIGDGLRGKRGLIAAYEVSESAAKLAVGEVVRAALIVVHDRDLEPRPSRDDRAGQVADVGKIFQYAG